MILKVIYERKKWFGIVPPFVHSAFEIYDKSKIKRVGFYEKFDVLWPISLLIPMPGELRKEPGSHYAIVVSKDAKKIKKVMELTRRKKYQWKVYHALFRNCFHWRNSILKEAGIKHPRGDWFVRVA